MESTRNRTYTGNETVGSEECRTALGVGRSSFYEAAKRDMLPVRVIRVGKQLRFSRRELEALLDGRKGGPVDANG